jgi:hypothetical protein
LYTAAEVVTGAVVGVGSVRELVGDGSAGFGVTLGVRLSDGSADGVVVGTEVGSVGCGVVGWVVAVGPVVVGSVTGVLVGADVGSEVRTGAVLADSSPPSNGLSSTSVISASGTAAIAPTLIRPGPPYRPIGPRTRLPVSSTQKAHPAGAGGHDSGGRQRFGGRQRAVGGSGQPGGALNCLTLPPPVTGKSLARDRVQRGSRSPKTLLFMRLNDWPVAVRRRAGTARDDNRPGLDEA